MKNKDAKQGNGLMSLRMFKELAKEKEDNCISIYIPTSRAGEKVISKHAQKKLKNKLKETSAALVEAGTGKKVFKARLGQIQNLPGGQGLPFGVVLKLLIGAGRGVFFVRAGQQAFIAAEDIIGDLCTNIVLFCHAGLDPASRG